MSETSSLDPTARDIWRTVRGPVIVLVLVLLVAIWLAYVRSQAGHGTLDPRSVDRDGSRALAQLLEDQGVTVELVRTIDEAVDRAGPDSMVLVTAPDVLDDGQLARLAGIESPLVLVNPGAVALGALAPQISVAAGSDLNERDPGCDFAAARVAGGADMGGTFYSSNGRAGGPTGQVTLCYPGGDAGSLAHVESNPPVTVLGTAVPLTNDRLDEEGNAALAMRVLGERERLVWYRPSPEDFVGGDESLTDLIPGGWKWAAFQLGIAVFLIALWRVRRLGPVVGEPLPVVVPSAEVVRGRAGLYHRSQAHGRAAAVLREATLTRITPLVGMHASSSPSAIVEAVASRTGRQPAWIGSLLYGADPADERALVSLADELDALEREVRRS